MFVREKISEGSVYFRDGSDMKGNARNVILPYEESELREGIRYSNKGNTKITVSGNRTGSAGGAVPNGGDVISMEHLSGVTAVGKDENGLYLTALACTSVKEFDETATDSEDLTEINEGALSEFNSGRYCFPVSVDEKSSVGGCIASNRSFIRKYVRRIKVVFTDSTYMSVTRGEFKADGRRMTFPAGRNYFSFQLPSYTSDGEVGPKIEDDMDLIDLFIGSEGIFGIITEADIYVSREPAPAVDIIELGKVNNDYISNTYGKTAADDLKRVKKVLDANYILNIGNLVV